MINGAFHQSGYYYPNQAVNNPMFAYPQYVNYPVVHKKHKCDFCVYQSDRSTNVKRHTAKKHHNIDNFDHPTYQANTCQIPDGYTQLNQQLYPTYPSHPPSISNISATAPAIAPHAKASNLNDKSRNVYPDDEKPRKQSGLRRKKTKSGGMNVSIDALKEMYKRRQSELRSVKTKSGGGNLAINALRRKDILDDDDDEYQMIKLFKCNFCSYSSERKRNVTHHMEKNHTLP